MAMFTNGYRKERLRKSNSISLSLLTFSYLSEGQIWNIIQAVASALTYLHENRIIHRDIKLHNCFITKDYMIKVRQKIFLQLVRRFWSNKGMQCTRTKSKNFQCRNANVHES
jgi:serine/threonine protein kinase